MLLYLLVHVCHIQVLSSAKVISICYLEFVTHHIIVIIYVDMLLCLFFCDNIIKKNTLNKTICLNCDFHFRGTKFADCGCN